MALGRSTSLNMNFSKVGIIIIIITIFYSYYEGKRPCETLGRKAFHS
jgi:hypothetical protein